MRTTHALSFPLQDNYPSQHRHPAGRLGSARHSRPDFKSGKGL